MDSTYATICYEQAGSVGTLMLTRPEKRNAQNPLMWEELRDLGRTLAGDSSLGCLVVTGDGDSFSAGIDLREGLAGLIGSLAGRSDEPAALVEGRGLAGSFRWITELECPSVAAVQGHAFGAGLQLALACDLRIFADDAIVALPETTFGIVPDMGGTVRLARIVGDGIARELVLLGGPVGANRAYEIGLANRVVKRSELRDEAVALAATLALRPRRALVGARVALDAAWALDYDSAFEAALIEQAACLGTDDFAAALATLEA